MLSSPVRYVKHNRIFSRIKWSDFREEEHHRQKATRLPAKTHRSGAITINQFYPAHPARAHPEIPAPTHRGPCLSPYET